MASLIYYMGCALIFSIYGYITLTDYRNSSWYVPAGLALALVGNFLWMMLARQLNNAADIAVAALLWDLVIVATIIMMPYVLGVPLAKHQWAGLIIAAIGISIALYK